jgi:serine/threonine-protein kinase RsbW
MRNADPEGVSVRLVLPNELRLLDVVHAASEKMAEIAGFDEDAALNVGLAMREAVINAMIHGNRRDPALKVQVMFEARPSRFQAKVIDEGAGFDPAKESDPTAAPNLLNTSGRGLLLMRAFVDEVRFRRRRSRGMEVTLVKNRAAASPTS